MGSLDIDSNFMGRLDIRLFCDIPLEEAIKTCFNELFKNIGTVHGLKIREFKGLLFLEQKNHFCIL